MSSEISILNRLTTQELQWIQKYARRGCDLHDLAVGLKQEHGVEETYHTLYRLFKLKGWDRPKARAGRSFTIYRVEGDSTLLMQHIDGTPRDDFANAWREAQIAAIPESIFPLDQADDPLHNQQDLSDMSTTIARIVDEKLESAGIKAPPEKPTWIRSISDIPDHTKAVVISDPHIPYEDPKAVDLALRFIREVGFDIIFLDGDIIDADPLSKFVKTRYAVTSFREQCIRARRFLNRVRRENPRSEIVYIFGNHEHRLETYIATRASELRDMPGADLSTVLRLSELDIQPMDGGTKENHVVFGDYNIGHWNMARKGGGSTSKGLIDKLGVNSIQAHAHRCAITRKRWMDRTVTVVENGCLCSLDPGYDALADWQHGFTVVYKIDGRCHPQLISMYDYTFVYDGHYWKV
jgi:predicted phosphodiesterase